MRAMNRKQNSFIQIETPNEWHPASVSPHVPIYLTPYKWCRTEERPVSNTQAVDRSYKLKHRVGYHSSDEALSNLPIISVNKIKPERHRNSYASDKSRADRTGETLSLPQATISRVYQKLHEDRNMDTPYMYEVKNLSKRGTTCQSSLPTIISTFNIQMKRSFKQVLSEAIQTRVVAQYGPDDMYLVPQVLPTREQRCLTSEKTRRRASSRSVKSQLSIEESPVRTEKHPDSADVYNKHLIKRVAQQP